MNTPCNLLIPYIQALRVSFLLFEGNTLHCTSVTTWLGSSSWILSRRQVNSYKLSVSGSHCHSDPIIISRQKSDDFILTFQWRRSHPPPLFRRKSTLWIEVYNPVHDSVHEHHPCPFFCIIKKHCCPCLKHLAFEMPPQKKWSVRRSSDCMVL